MKRKIVRIDEEKCTGCGLCIEACHEGALQLVNGKAKLVSESYCDGLGDCLPACPAGAITIEERRAAPYEGPAPGGSKKENLPPAPSACGCPGTHIRSLEKEGRTDPVPAAHSADAVSELRQWPCQLKLVPVEAPYFDHAHLLVAADCTAYAYAGLHRDFMRRRITLIGCPKLDGVDYAEKLAAILKGHDIMSITVLKMEVPCCGGLVNAVKNALVQSGKTIPWQVVTVGIDGKILAD